MKLNLCGAKKACKSSILIRLKRVVERHLAKYVWYKDEWELEIKNFPET